MKTRLGVVFRGALACCLAATLPALSQNSQQQPSTRPAPGGPPQTNPGQRPPSQPSRPPSQPQNPPSPPQHRPPSQPQHPPSAPPQHYPSSPPSYRPPSQPPSYCPPQPPPAHRPPQWGRPPQYHLPYQFRPNDWDYLYRYYGRNLGYINRARRPVFTVGGFLPWGYYQYITPLPPNVFGYLPPPPPGYQMGYFNGYVVVYDPRTGFILNVIDLLR